MYILHQFALCPFSRLVRVLLSEKQCAFKLVEEKYWERNNSLARINPALEVPVLVAGSHSICSIYAICEYLEESVSPKIFLTEDPLINAEIRRLCYWFNDKFHHEVTKYFIEEKIISHYMRRGAPRTEFIRAARNNLVQHLDYMELLLNSRKWLAGDVLSLADLTAAAQISSLDYLGDMNWDKHQLTKEWYAVLKSRPSFRQLLVDRIVGFTPPPHYQNLDF